MEGLLLTPRAINAEKIRSPVPLEKFGWALFGIMNTSHWYIMSMQAGPTRD